MLQHQEPTNSGRITFGSNSVIKAFRGTAFAVFVTIFALMGTANADEITDWNQIAQQAVRTANVSAPISPRYLAIVHAAVFDAVNGIERRYTPYHVEERGPRGASSRAAAIQAAYVTLRSLFPLQNFDAQRLASLAALNDDHDDGDENEFDDEFEDNERIARGIAWGQRVADEILLWRSTDGFSVAPPPYFGGTAVGQWRSLLTPAAPAVFQQLAFTTPFAIQNASRFRPEGPPALTSDEYAADFNEVKAYGAAMGSLRTQFQSDTAVFWSDNSPLLVNQAAVSVAKQRHKKLAQNARLFALVNIAMVDSAIACWDAKRTYNFWRPTTAIRLADTDGNPATAPDPAWVALIATPNHQEYPSGHSTSTGAGIQILATYFGYRARFTLESATLPSAPRRTYRTFSSVAQEVKDARVWGGIHFRSACNQGQAIGSAVADYVFANIARPIHERHDTER